MTTWRPRNGGHAFHGHGVFASDPSTGETVWFGFDTYGHLPIPPARGRWSDNVLTLERVTAREVGRVRFELRDAEHIYAAENKLLDATEFVPITRSMFKRSPD